MRNLKKTDLKLIAGGTAQVIVTPDYRSMSDDVMYRRLDLYSGKITVGYHYACVMPSHYSPGDADYTEEYQKFFPGKEYEVHHFYPF